MPLPGALVGESLLEMTWGKVNNCYKFAQIEEKKPKTA